MATSVLQVMVALAEKLPPEDQDALMKHLTELARKRNMTAEEKIRILHAAQFPPTSVLLNDPSDRREDWYDDDGR